jgi:hypothetical protein
MPWRSSLVASPKAMLLSDACKHLQENIACLFPGATNVAGFLPFTSKVKLQNPWT